MSLSKVLIIKSRNPSGCLPFRTKPRHVNTAKQSLCKHQFSIIEDPKKGRVRWSGAAAKGEICSPGEELSVSVGQRIYVLVACIMLEATERLKLAFFKIAGFLFSNWSCLDLIIQKMMQNLFWNEPPILDSTYLMTWSQMLKGVGTELM